MLSKEKSLVDKENELRKKELKWVEKEDLLEEKEETKTKVLSHDIIKKPIIKGKKGKAKPIKKVKKEKPRKIMRIEKKDISFMIKEIGEYVARGDIAGAKHALSRLKKSYNKLNKQDKESLRYDIIALETDIKLASLNL